MAKTWITDENGNHCSVERWGSDDKAREALASNKDCSGCSDCSDCSDCSRCWSCSGCSGCSSRKTDPVAVPIIENIHQTVYAAASAPKALDMSTWHTCGTTHCRAGWVVTLAGAPGAALEKRFDTPLAAWLIYKASDPNIKYLPNWFTDNASALADMKRLAEEEAARIPAPAL